MTVFCITLLITFRIDLKFLLFVMKFVYHFANLNDVEILYEMVKKTNVKVPMKTIEEVKDSAVLGQPLAISDYLLDLNQYEPIPATFKNKFWTAHPNLTTIRVYNSSTEFKPMLTDAGLCSVYNAPMISDVFEDSTVMDFKEVFMEGTQQTEVRSAAMGEYTFIIDTNMRSQYPFRTVDSKDFVRYGCNLKLL